MMTAIIVSVSRIWKPREFIWINIVGLRYKKKVIVHRFFFGGFPHCVRGLRPLFRCRSRLRIWTSRPYFKDNPNEAIRRIASLKEDTSDYVRKSVGNALRDISKKFPELIEAELNNWNLESKEINQVYKLASKFIS